MATTLSTAELRTIVEVRATLDSIKSSIKSNIERSCSALMDEPVSIAQVLAVLKVVIGLACVPFLFQLSTCFIGLIGFFFIYSGTSKLR